MVWFFCKKNGARIGPVVWSDLLSRAETGELSRDDLVWTAGMASWQAAATIPELYVTVAAVPAPRLPASSPPPPSAQAPIGQGNPQPIATAPKKVRPAKKVGGNKLLLASIASLVSCAIVAAGSFVFLHRTSSEQKSSSSSSAVTETQSSHVQPASAPAQAAPVPKTLPVGKEIAASAGNDTDKPASTKTDSGYVAPANTQVVARSSQLTNEGGSTLEQASQGLLWTQNDNGKEIDWIEAKSYCARQGEAWRLPSTNELTSIFDASGAYSTSCGTFTCKVSHLFNLSAGGYWSSVEVGSSSALVFVLDGGVTYPGRIDGKGNVRALCVRPMTTLPVNTKHAATPDANASASTDGSVTDHCESEAPPARTPEEFALIENGHRHLTGKSVGVGARGEFFIVEAALGYDGMCRPSPYQIYVFNKGKQVGTLSPNAMQARSDGAITDFKQLDADHLQIEIEHYKPTDPLCCASSREKRIVSLSQFSAQAPQPSAGSNAQLPPSFDCRKATTATEIAICASPELSNLDGQLGRAFSDAYAAARGEQVKNLRLQQVAWIKTRDEDCKGEASCLDSYLRKRIAELAIVDEVKSRTDSRDEPTRGNNNNSDGASAAAGAANAQSSGNSNQGSVGALHEQSAAPKPPVIESKKTDDESSLWADRPECKAYKSKMEKLNTAWEKNDDVFARQEWVHVLVAAKMAGCYKGD